MNRRQKSLLVNFTIVVFVTVVFILAMTNIKDWLNRSEARRAMEYIGQQVLSYRDKRGSLPPETYLTPMREQLVRLGDFTYRAQWIDFESGPDTILAYTKRDFRSLWVPSGYVVLRLDGRVEWMGKTEFEHVLHTQQSQREIEMLQNRLKRGPY